MRPRRSGLGGRDGGSAGRRLSRGVLGGLRWEGGGEVRLGSGR